VLLSKDSLFAELEMVMKNFIRPSFRYLLSKLSDYTQEKLYQSLINARLIAFLCFTICLSLSYLIFWLPFIRNLNREVGNSSIAFDKLDVENKVHAQYHSYRGHSPNAQAP